MNPTTLRKLLATMAAISVFYLLSLVYFSPVLGGKQLVQGDIRNFRGMAQEIVEHRELTDTDPLWTGSMFNGMPAYQISVIWSANKLAWADDLFHGFLPRPASFLFLYLLGMYILLCCLRIDPWLAIVGAVAFGFSSYFFVILEAGHNSKANAIGYMPMVLGAVYELYRGRKWLGAALLALFLGLQITQNHVQITYYLGFVLVLFVLAEALRAAREGAFKDLVARSGLGAMAVVLALVCNMGLLWTTSQYGAYTTRGKSELTVHPDGTSASDVQTTGLDRDYVTAWSYGKQESFSLLIPNAKGGASGSMITAREDFNAFNDDREFRTALENEYRSGYVNSYWGDQSFTSGPVYIGAIVVLLMLLGLARVHGKGLWWILGSVPFVAIMLLLNNPVVADALTGMGLAPSLVAGLLLIAYLIAGLFLWKDPLPYALFSALLITLMLSWGRNYMPLTDFFLDHVPGYSKFRAVTIILVIVELAAPVLAMLHLDRLMREGDRGLLTDKRFLIPAGVLTLLLLAFLAVPGAFLEFISDAERAIFNQRIDSDPATEADVISLVDGIKDYRMGVFRMDALRSLGFVLVGLGVLALFIKRMVPKAAVIVVLGLAMLLDGWTVDKRYVNNEKERGRYLAWEEKKSADLPFKPDTADSWILRSEWNPQVQAYHQRTIQRMKEARSHERGTARLVSKDEEVIARYGSLRRSADFRVLNLRDPFNDGRTSYFHKSIGGYHGAKLKRYQELIEFHLGPAVQRLGKGLPTVRSQEQLDSLLGSEGVLNMLNVRYLKYDPARPPLPNDNAFGSAWFVDDVKWVKNADEEILALGTIDPRRTALVDERYREQLGAADAIADSTAKVTLDHYATDSLTYTVRSSAGGVVVFSAIWYGPDWKAYVDGKESTYACADYVLRAMHVPAGEHKVVFKIDGGAYGRSAPISMAASILVLLLALGAVGMQLVRSFRSSGEGA